MKTTTQLHNQINELLEFPQEIEHPQPQIMLQGFFPVCTGTIDGSTDLTNKKIMIVGQDFGNERDVDRAKKNGENIKTVSTWKQIIPMLENLGIEPTDCFYTNYLMGVRKTNSNMGPSQALTDNDYRNSCIKYFKQQVTFLQPALIIFLGKVAYHLATAKAFEMKSLDKPYLKDIVFLNTSNPHFQCDGFIVPCFYLIHPAQRRLNISNKIWCEQNEQILKPKIAAIIK